MQARWADEAAQARVLRPFAPVWGVKGRSSRGADYLEKTAGSRSAEMLLSLGLQGTFGTQGLLQIRPHGDRERDWP